MASFTYYNAGTASVANGETTITGSGNIWSGGILPGDLFCDPAQPLVPPQRIASVGDDGSLELAVGWPGTTMVDDPYEIRFVGAIERSTAQTRRLLEQLTVVQANGRGLFYRFSDTTAAADPGAGYIRFNQLDLTTATAAYIDVLDANGATVSGEIDTWDDSTSLGKGNLWIRGIADPSAFRAYELTGSVVDGSGYRKLTLTYVGGSGSFAADDELMVAFARTGDIGDGFAYDTTVADPSELTALEGETAGYLVFVTDLQTDFGAYSGRSGVVKLIAGPDWELVALYTGPKGDTGDQGDKGWSPQLVIVSDGARRVFQLSGYAGGAGSAPTANVGEYLKSDGTFTATIGDAVDVRGPAGLNGSGTVASVEAGTGISVDNTDPTAPVISADTSLAAVDEDILPDTDSTRDLGSASKAWAETHTDKVVTPAVSFPATAVPSADPNTLDDYEEGTWTPTLTAVANCSALSLTEAKYVKIGRLVHIEARVTGTVTSSSTLTIFSFTLPFNQAASNSYATGLASEGNNSRIGMVRDNTGSNPTTGAVIFPAASAIVSGSALFDLSLDYICDA